MAEDRRSEPLTEKDWAWFDRNRLKYLNEDDKGYYAGEFGSLLVRARDDLAALTRELEELRTDASTLLKPILDALPNEPLTVDQVHAMYRLEARLSRGQCGEDDTL